MTNPNKDIKITDLEEFALKHIYRPYQNTLTDQGIKTLNKQYNLNNADVHLANDPDWQELVINRLKSIGIYFPDYIHHPLVDYLKRRL